MSMARRPSLIKLGDGVTGLAIIDREQVVAGGRVVCSLID
jgi:hypothetical protein